MRDDVSSLPAMSEPEKGANNYRIGREIACGGMGNIMEAEDGKLKRTVAIKTMLLEADADEALCRRFVNEAQVLAQLAHPNIMPIHDLVWENGLPLFYTMKLVKGRTLQAILHDLRKGKVSVTADCTLDRLLVIFRKVCDALAFAHSKDIIHRDLKPENIMVGEFGEVLVMDWGLAKRLGDEARGTPGQGESARQQPPSGEVRREVTGSPSTLTDTQADAEALPSFTALYDTASPTTQGTVMGTPEYMAPEQALGYIDELDARSDIYSLGAMLYAILTLRAPVKGHNLEEILGKVTRGEITAPSSIPPRTNGQVPTFETLPHIIGGRVPAALSAVAMKALQKDKDQRYQSVAELSTEVEAYQGGFATTAEQASTLTQMKLLMLRHKVVTIAFGVLLLVSIGFTLKVMASERAAKHSEELAIASEKTAKTAEAVAVREQNITRQALARTNIALADASLREGNGPAMQAALRQVPDDLRDNTWRYLLAQSDTSFSHLTTGTGNLLSLVPYPTRPSVFAITNSNLKVSLLDVRSRKSLLEFLAGFPTQNGQAQRLAVSRDGTRIALGRDGDGGIVIHSAQDDRKLLSWNAPGSSLLEFSPNGKLLLQVEQHGWQIIMWDATTGSLLWSCNEADDSNNMPTLATFTPDGAQVLAHALHNPLRLLDAQDGKLVRSLGEPFPGGVSAMAIRPDNEMIVTGAAAYGPVRGIRLKDSKTLFEFRPHDQTFVHIAFTPDGRRFITIAKLLDGRQALEVWDAETGTPLQTLLGGTGAIFDACVHPLSGELVVTGPVTRAWKLAETPEQWTLRLAGRALVVPSAAFWGADDIMFAPTPDHRSVLQRLEPGGTRVLWKTEDANYLHPTVSVDGTLAAIGRLGTDQPVLLLKNPGPQVAQVGSVKPSGPLVSSRLSPDGNRILIASLPPAESQIFDTQTGQMIATLERPGIAVFRDFGWSHRGQRLIGLATSKEVRGNLGSEEKIILWDAATGKMVRSVANATALDVMAVAPDGLRFAEAGVDQRVRLRDTETLAVLWEFRAHDGPITAMAWHPSRPVLATASTDLSVRLWDLDTGLRLEEMRGPTFKPRTLMFSPSGRRIACGSYDGTSRVWDPVSLSEGTVPRKDSEGWEDRLAPLTPAAVMLTGGGWMMDDRLLVSPQQRRAVLPLPGDLAGTSYQVRVKLRTTTGKNVFHLALPVADKMTAFELDGYPSHGFLTGLLVVDDNDGPSLPGVVTGKQVTDDLPHVLEVTVNLKGAEAQIAAVLDDRPIYTWSGPIASLAQHPRWQTTPGHLALGSYEADWAVLELKVKKL